VTIDQVAASYDISRNHLIKVINGLAQAGFIATQRGRGGGFVLARPANCITVSEVVKFGEDGAALLERFDPASNRCAITTICKMKSMFGEAMRAFHGVLVRYTIAAVCSNPEPLLRHLGLPAAE
jgi:Rrf2 family nitric oxide-sensitive transcriptional repressor